MTLPGRMRRKAATLALPLFLAACAPGPTPYDSSPSGAMAHMSGDLNMDPCTASVWITGVIVGQEQGFVGLRDDRGVVYPLIWGSHNTAVVDYGRRYKIGGTWFPVFEGRFWACAGADAVIPQ